GHLKRERSPLGAREGTIPAGACRAAGSVTSDQFQRTADVAPEFEINRPTLGRFVAGVSLLGSLAQRRIVGFPDDGAERKRREIQLPLSESQFDSSLAA